MWRTTGDIADHYLLMDHIGFGQNGLEKYAGPNRWNDPDALNAGMGGMTKDEYLTQMSLWCMLAAPLFASNDLTHMSPETLAILTNREVIAVDQDPAGVQGHRVWQEGPTEIWTKALADGSKAVGLFNRNEVAMTMTVNFQDIGIAAPGRVRDLWAQKDLAPLDRSYTTTVPGHGVVMLRIYK
jgi:alpha-galactosidase